MASVVWGHDHNPLPTMFIVHQRRLQSHKACNPQLLIHHDPLPRAVCTCSVCARAFRTLGNQRHLPWDGIELLLLAVRERFACLNDHWGNGQCDHCNGELRANLGGVGVVVVGVAQVVLQALNGALPLQINRVLVMCAYKTPSVLATLVCTGLRVRAAYCDSCLGAVANEGDHSQAAVLDLLQLHGLGVHAHRVEGHHVEETTLHHNSR